MPSLAGVLVVVAVTACNVAPREVETVLKLSPERVMIEVVLRDIRTGAPDDLYQLQVFEPLSTWQPMWTEDMPWAPTPELYRFSADAGALTLTMKGAMKRAEFDRCARGFSTDGGEPTCPRFPLHLTAAGYSLPEGFVENQHVILSPRAQTTWRADAGVIALTLTLTPLTEQVTEGPSFVRGFELHQLASAAAQTTVKAIETMEKQLSTGAPEWKKTLDGLKGCTDQPWCALRTEALRRAQARLLSRLLAESGEAGEGLRETPEDARIISLEGGPGYAVPSDKLTPLDALRLRVRYDTGLSSYRETGSLGWSPATWAPICRPDVVKKRSLKELCTKLGAP